MKRTVKTRVIEAASKEIMKLQCEGQSSVEYKIHVYIRKVDKNGAVKTESFKTEFKDKDMLTNRREAIQYYIQTLELYNTNECNFSKPKVAKKKGYKDYNCFSMSLELSYEETSIELENCSECFFELLSYESLLLKKSKAGNFITVIDCNGENVEVLEEGYDLLNILFNQN